MDIEMYPNTAQNELQLVINGVPDAGSELRLLDPNGRIWRQWKGLTAGRQTIWLPNVPSGLYFVEYVGHDQRLTRKLVIRQ